MDSTEKRRNLENAVDFRRNDIRESQQAGEELIYSEYAADKTKLENLNKHTGPLTKTYTDEMDDLGIDYSKDETAALKELQNKVKASRQVEAKRRYDTIGGIL